MRYLRTKRDKMGHMLDHEDLFGQDKGVAGESRDLHDGKGPHDDDLRRQAERQGAEVRHRRRPLQRAHLRRGSRGRPGLPGRHGVADGDVDVAWVPGAFEIPLVASRLAASGRYDAVICLGAVIRGATPHFDYVAAEVAKGVAKVSLDTGVPVVFGVLTTDTIEQAIERAGTKAGNKGWAAAAAAIEMANLAKTLP